jgi:hypothetical protein
MSGIGQLNEKALHAALKQWYRRPGDRFEVAVDGYVIDIVRDGLLIEIQTGSFTPMKAKLASLVRSHPVRLVHPIVQEKWIVRPAAAGGVLRRRSPKRGRWEDLFWELVSLPELLPNPNFSVEVLLIRAEEARRVEGKRRRRRKGWEVEERRLLEVVGTRLFRGLADWRAVLPDGLGSFTAADLAAATKTRAALAGKIAYCLRRAGLIELEGRRGRAHLYRPADACPS